MRCMGCVMIDGEPMKKLILAAVSAFQTILALLSNRVVLFTVLIVLMKFDVITPDDLGVIVPLIAGV